MSEVIKAVVKFPRVSGVPADTVDHDWYFLWNTAGSPILSDLVPVVDALTAFYNTASSDSGFSVGHYMSEELERSNDADVALYRVPAVAGPLGAPTTMGTVLFSAAVAGTPFPSEVAVCMSYRSLYDSDVEFLPGERPRATHRGRVYIGPLQSVSTELANHEVTPSSAFINDVVENAVHFMSNGDAESPLNGTDWVWVQFSIKEWRSLPVAQVWVDDAFDTQRRRGRQAQTRMTAVTT